MSSKLPYGSRNKNIVVLCGIEDLPLIQVNLLPFKPLNNMIYINDKHSWTLYLAMVEIGLRTSLTLVDILLLYTKDYRYL